MVGEKDKLRKETTTTISQMLSQTTSPLAPRTSEVLVSGDTMKIDQTNVTLNIDDTNALVVLNQMYLILKMLRKSLNKLRKRRGK